MHPLKKVVKASARRRTRFHTERGRLMPLSAWLRLPRSVRTRLSATEPDGPWMVPAAVERLDELIRPTWDVLEFGSGASTLWFAERATSVVSFEDDARWHELVRARIEQAGLDGCDLRHVSLHDFPRCAARFAPGSFDLVVVDGNEQPGATRADCAAVARPLVRPGGVLVVDDSDIREYQPMFELFADWTWERFVGVKHRPLMAVETSLFHRPDEDAAPLVAARPLGYAPRN